MPNEAVLRWSEGVLGDTILLYSLAILLQYLALGLLAFADARRELREQRLADRLSLFEGDLAPPVSLLVPAYNEEATIVDNVRSLMQLRYPAFEIVVVNDGSKDGTLPALVHAFALQRSYRTLRARVPRERVRGVYASPDYPALVVLDLVNGGKARALNIALGFSRHPLFCAIDADSLLERDTLLHLALPFFFDPRVAVTGGFVRPANGCVIERGLVQSTGLPRSHLARFQIVEYLRGMLAGRMGWNRIDSLFIVSGALGMFSREAVMAVGGYRTDTLGEDMELVMRLQRWAARHGHRRAVRFTASAVAWTEVPETVRGLERQRSRWHQGLTESLWLNRELLTRELFTPAHGVAFASQVCVELLGPVVELSGFVLFAWLAVTGHLGSPFAILYLLISVMGGTVSSLIGILLEIVVCPRYERGRDLAMLGLYALLENVGYRQLSVFWRVRGLWNALLRRKVWGEMTRRGHSQAADAGTDAGADAPQERAAA
jgi:cellulose synthase/poly-beta-1,6-N-acetylglucosamine synthase-like glycosyltransferase